MRRRARQSLRTVALAVMLGVSVQTNAYALEEPTPSGLASGAAAGFDLVILRPLRLAALVVGVGAFVPAAFLTAPNGKEGVQEAMGVLVTEPARNVFQRPLGDF